MSIKAVLFDKDGTLIDVNGTWVPFYRHMLAQEQGLSPRAVEDKMIAAGYDPATVGFRAGSTLAGGTTRQLVGLWWPNQSDEEQHRTAVRIDNEYAALALHHLKPLMPLQPVLQALQQLGLVLGVGTNDSERSAVNHMEALGVAGAFRTIMGADSVAAPKPSGDMVRKFAHENDFDVSEIAMVGDNIHDLEEGRHGGAGLALAVLTGNANRHHLEEHADHVFESVADLPDFFRSR